MQKFEHKNSSVEFKKKNTFNSYKTFKRLKYFHKSNTLNITKKC